MPAVSSDGRAIMTNGTYYLDCRHDESPFSLPYVHDMNKYNNSKYIQPAMTKLYGFGYSTSVQYMSADVLTAIKSSNTGVNYQYPAINYPGTGSNDAAGLTSFKFTSTGTERASKASPTHKNTLTGTTDYETKISEPIGYTNINTSTSNMSISFAKAPNGYTFKGFYFINMPEVKGNYDSIGKFLNTYAYEFMDATTSGFTSNADGSYSWSGRPTSGKTYGTISGKTDHMFIYVIPRYDQSSNTVTISIKWKDHTDTTVQQSLIGGENFALYHQTVQADGTKAYTTDSYSDGDAIANIYDYVFETYLLQMPVGYTIDVTSNAYDDASGVITAERVQFWQEKGVTYSDDYRGMLANW